MALHYTEFLQVKEKGNLMFEKDLYQLSDILGRPAPEFRGAQVDAHDQGNLSSRFHSPKSVCGATLTKYQLSAAFDILVKHSTVGCVKLIEFSASSVSPSSFLMQN